MLHNAISIDVEDYYMVSAFSDVVPFDKWPLYESRVEGNTLNVLSLLDKCGVKATFFILGWVAERHPGLVKEIFRLGHEVASHGYSHRLIYEMSPEGFRQDVRLSKKILEDITGIPVAGYRAPSYSIVKNNLWALDVLIEEGYRYDSSIFPVHHDRYGIPGADRFLHVIKRDCGEIIEIPPSTYRMLNQNLPVAGGGYLRLYPLAVTRRAIASINEKERKPVVLYFHPWEIDPEQPRLKGKWISEFRHYVNLKKTAYKLHELLQSFSFMPVQGVINQGIID